MTTRREFYIQALIDAFNAIPDFPAEIERTIDGAFSRDEGRVLVVHRGGEIVALGQGVCRREIGGASRRIFERR